MPPAPVSTGLATSLIKELGWPTAVGEFIHHKHRSQSLISKNRMHQTFYCLPDWLVEDHKI